jgi:putative transposase
MPRRKEQFITGDTYHIVVRALDDNLIFKDTNDYFRGIFSIYEFNNSKPVTIFIRRRDRKVEKKKEKLSDFGSPTVLDERDCFVEVLAFCFMPNHMHLLVRQMKEGGISKFMQKIGIGLSKYLNKKYERKGHVFQDVFRSVRIENDKQLITVFNYIHVNPLSLYEPGWKEKGISDINESIRFLENYKWSSYQDYIGKKNFPSVTERRFLAEFMDDADGCKNAIKNWLEYKNNITQSSSLFLEE